MTEKTIVAVTDEELDLIVRSWAPRAVEDRRELPRFGETPRRQRVVEVPVQRGDESDEPAGDNPWGTPE